MLSKPCSWCKEDLPVEQFSKSSRSRDGLAYLCKSCEKAKTTAWRKKVGYRQTFTAEQLAAKNDAKLKHRYGLTRAEIEAKVVEQGGCAVCHTETPGGKNWHVDHDHKCCPGQTTCGKCVRGILCGACNRALGLFDDNPTTLLSAASYLMSYLSEENEHVRVR